MPEYCNGCALRELQEVAEDGFAFCKACKTKLDVGVCSRCAFKNGELDDTCRNCGAAIIDSELMGGGVADANSDSGGRKLKQNNSHDDAPAKKTANTDSTGTPSTDDQIPAWASAFQTQLMQGLTSVVQSELGAVRSDVTQLKSSVQSVSGKADKAIAIAGDARQKADESIRLVEKLREDFQRGNINSSSTLPGSTTALFGGFTDMTKDKAETWLKNKPREFGFDPYTNLYTKGDEFQGVLFAKFSSNQVMQQVIQAIIKNRPKAGKSEIWCKRDRPIEPRTAISALLALRKQLVTWKFAKSSIKIDEESFTMTVGGVSVVTAHVLDHNLSFNWTDETWGKWTELQDSSELKDIMDKANARLQKAAQMSGKGDGKGRADQ